MKCKLVVEYEKYFKPIDYAIQITETLDITSTNIRSYPMLSINLNKMFSEFIDLVALPEIAVKQAKNLKIP